MRLRGRGLGFCRCWGRSFFHQDLADKSVRATRTYPANRKTPAATKTAAVQRRRSTFSCRNSLAAKAFATKVRDAEAGPTMLTSPHERAKSRLKKLRAMKAMPSIRDGVRSTRRMVCPRPLCLRSAPRSPTCFMARARRQSPVVEVTTIRKTPSQA